MESKFEQKKQKLLQKIFERIQLFLKKYCFLNLKMLKDPENEGKILYKYVGKQSQKELRWLFSLDKIQHSQKAAKFTQDIQVKIHQAKHRYSHHRSKLSTSNTRENLRKVPISIHAQVKQDQRLFKNIQLKQNCKNFVPLNSSEESSKNFEQFEESNEDYIVRIRQRKYQRQQFKSKMAQEQYSKKDPAFRKKKIKEIQAMNKKQKYNLCQHFIEVDASLKQSEQAFSKIIPQKLHKKYKTSNKILTNSHQKQIIKKNSLIYTTREWQPLKTQDRQFVLKPLHELKLALGVTTRQYSNKSLNFEPNNSNASLLTRKKLLLLKNNDKNPAKIKLNDLLCLKKQGTMNQLVYCTSMKTMKNIKDTKENIQSTLSIDSRQFPSEILPKQKKHIKIANHSVFEELIVQKSEAETQDASNYRSKLKIKKQGKVRFDNMI